MLQIVTRSIKWASIPVLLVASIFSRYAASGEHLVDFAICLGAFILLGRAVWMRQYCWGGGFVAIGVVFFPVFLAVKIFLLMALTCIAALTALWFALRRQPVAALAR